MINLHERMLPTSAGGWTRNLLVSSRKAHPNEPPRPAHVYTKQKDWVQIKQNSSAADELSVLPYST